MTVLLWMLLFTYQLLFCLALKNENTRMFIKYNLHFFKEITLKQFPLRNLSEFLCGKEKVMKALSTVAYILRNFNSSF